MLLLSTRTCMLLVVLVFGITLAGMHVEAWVRFSSLALFLLASCLEQYDPRPYWQKFEDERLLAHRQLPSLTETGELPQFESEIVDLATVVETKYQQFCSNCHGAEGKGDGIAGKALSPQPRDFTDKFWQDSVDDAHVQKVIAQGGVDAGLSNAMAGFGAILSKEEIKEMVAKIRKFKR